MIKIKLPVSELEELKEYIDTHCHIGIDCDEENGEVWCINHASKELRDEYASKYGCICGACCRKCINFTACYSDGDCKHLCNPDACRFN